MPGDTAYSEQHRGDTLLYNLLTAREHAWVLAAEALHHWHRATGFIEEAFRISEHPFVYSLLSVNELWLQRHAQTACLHHQNPHENAFRHTCKHILAAACQWFRAVAISRR